MYSMRNPLFDEIWNKVEKETKTLLGYTSFFDNHLTLLHEAQEKLDEINVNYRENLIEHCNNTTKKIFASNNTGEQVLTQTEHLGNIAQHNFQYLSSLAKLCNDFGLSSLSIAQEHAIRLEKETERSCNDIFHD